MVRAGYNLKTNELWVINPAGGKRFYTYSDLNSGILLDGKHLKLTDVYRY